MAKIDTCEMCGRHEPTRFVQATEITGILIVSQRRTRSGYFCQTCARQVFAQAQKHNNAFGIWSVPSLLALPAVSSENSRALARVLADFTRPEPTSSNPHIAALPWSKLVGVKVKIRTGEIQLTAPLLIICLSGLFGGISLIAFAAMLITPGNNTPEEALLIRNWSGAILLFCSLALAIGLYWQRARKLRQDLVPDVLAAVLPTAAIYELSRVHLSAFAFQTGTRVRVVLCIQNRLDYLLKFRGQLHGAQMPMLTCEIPASSVILAFADCPLPPLASPINVRLTLAANVACVGGTQVRFAAREVLSSQSRNTLVSAAMVFGGHISVDTSPDRRPTSFAFMSRFAQIELRLSPSPPDPATAASAQLEWQTIPLWTPQAPATADESAQVLCHVLGVTAETDGTLNPLKP
jgi:hypothetical protein